MMDIFINLSFVNLLSILGLGVIYIQYTLNEEHLIISFLMVKNN